MRCSRRAGLTPSLTDTWRDTKTKRAPTPRCDRPNKDPDSLELNQNAKKHSSSSPLCFIFYAKVSMLDKRSEKLEMFFLAHFIVWADKFDQRNFISLCCKISYLLAVHCGDVSLFLLENSFPFSLLLLLVFLWGHVLLRLSFSLQFFWIRNGGRRKTKCWLLQAIFPP